MPLAVSAQPANPVGFHYQPGPVPAAYRAKHAMAVLGRDPTNTRYTGMAEMAAAGGIPGVYLDGAINNPAGRYHPAMLAGAKLLPAGNQNSWGRAIDLAGDAPAHTRRMLLAIEQMQEELSWCRMLFLDDWGPDNDAIYGALSAAYRVEMYEAYIEISKALAALLNQMGWLSYVNALWRHDRGHGYPITTLPGCGLFTGSVCEHHDADIASGGWWRSFLERAQGNLRDAAGFGLHIVIASSVAGARNAAGVRGVGFVSPQVDGNAYGAAPTPPVTPRDLGVIAGTTPPPPPSGVSLPSAPTGLVVVPFGADGGGAVMLDWLDNSTVEQVDSFVVYVDGVERERNIPLSTVVVAGLTPGRSYGFRVSAHNAAAQNDGHGPWSAEVRFTVPAAPPPGPPVDPCADRIAALQGRLDAATIAQATAEEQRDTALVDLATRTTERDTAAAMALELRGRIDTAKQALG